MPPLPLSGALLLCAVASVAVLVVLGLLALTWAAARRPLVERSRLADSERAHLRLLEKVAVTANEARSVEGAVAEVLALVAADGRWALGHAFLCPEDEDAPLVSLPWHVAGGSPGLQEFVARSEAMTFDRGVGLPGRVIESSRPLWLSPVNDLSAEQFPRTRYADAAGLRTFCGFPVMSRDEVLGLVEFFSPQVRHVDEALLGLMHHIGTQLGRVVERERAERRLTTLALHDPLTGLANRRLFAERVDAALQRAARHGTRVAVLLLDLDGFKSVNDSMGHVVGDNLLAIVATRLGETVRTSDTVARLGGDEFAVAMTDVPTADEARRLSRRILRCLSAPVELGGRRIEVGASVGISLSSGEGTTTTQLLRDADLAMYSAKGAGKGRAAVFDPVMHSSLMDRIDLEQDLGRAGERGELSLVYQPIVETATGRVRSREALLRWQHPTRGAVAPTTFIPVAEESGLIDVVGRWVLEMACADAAAWQVGDGFGVGVSVNLSALQVRRGLVEQVVASLERTGLPAHLLVLEVTESLLMDSSGGAVEVLDGLRGLGVRVSVDDFGTGHSSLGRLRGLPLDEFKIDRSFLVDLHDPTASAIVETVIAMAAALGRSVVAEGVETEEQLRFLADHGCELVQGYLLGRPASFAERGPDRVDVATLLRAASAAPA